jgi:hypothetical protein
MLLWKTKAGIKSINKKNGKGQPNLSKTVVSGVIIIVYKYTLLFPGVNFGYIALP